MKQYKFESWYKGNVTLIYSEVSFKEKDDNGKKVKPVFVTWNNFDDSEVIKIKKMQKEIFDENVSLYLEKFKSEFSERYSKSLMAEEFLEIEKQECFNILFSKIPNKEFVITKNWKIPFNHNELLEIQDYANRTLLSGIDVCLDFVHSPNNKYQINNKIPSQVYAQLLYDYFKWLDVYFNSSDKTDKNNLSNQNNQKVEQENPYPSIFKNGSSYEMFVELKKMSVNQNTQLADYAFIFHSMKRRGYILENTKHRVFIELLNNKFDADISAIKFPFKNQNSKQQIFYNLIDTLKP